MLTSSSGQLHQTQLDYVIVASPKAQLMLVPFAERISINLLLGSLALSSSFLSLGFFCSIFTPFSHSFKASILFLLIQCVSAQIQSEYQKLTIKSFF